MSLIPGHRLGPYEVVAPIGAGGMGEVYRAHDTKLDRDVAIKILPESFAHDAERVARFEREAKVLAALNHPNIAQIYGLEERALVMELVEGPTLAERIAQGPVPVDEALNIAKQIAEALEAAHEKGITHRDLKPANVKVRADGTVKVLDFGLATAAQSATADGNPSISPTLTLDYAATRAGMIMGTAAYMSPEQASGKQVDKRSDIWSFGVVLWEMLTGKRLFEGETISHVMAAVLTKEPELNAVPMKVRLLLQRCLEKYPKRRLRDIGDWELLLSHDRHGGADASAPSSPWVRFGGVAWIVTGALAIVAALGWVRTVHPTNTTAGYSEVAFSIPPPSGKALQPVGALFVDRISPDGSMVLFRASGRFYVRKLNSLEADLLPEFTWFGDPFWAPGSRSIAFPIDANRLIKIHMPKGSPELITKDMPGAERGGSWGDRGVILFALADSSPGGSALYSVPANGGTPTRLQVSGLGQGGSFNPEFLPGGKDFLFEFNPLNSNEAQVYLATLADGKATNVQLLLNNETAAAYTPAGGGRVLFVRNDNLYSQKLDLNVRKLSGDPELLQEHVASYAGWRNAHFSVSRTGTIAWRSGTAVVSQVAVFDRAGNQTGVAGPPSSVDVIRLSPDESHLLVWGRAGSTKIVEVNSPGQIELNWQLAWPIWSPDGSKVISISGTKLVEGAVTGASQLTELAEIPIFQESMTQVSPDGSRGGILDGVSPDGRRVLFGDGSAPGLFWLGLDRNGSPQRLFGQRADNATISPDGTWIVYRPNAESGLYVQPVSGTGLPKQIASAGTFPVWRADGKEILFLDRNNNSISTVRVEGSTERLQFSMPQSLFKVATPLGLASGSRPLAVNRDGSRIYFLQSAEESEAGVINVRTGAIR